jgi:uncharacterized protein YeaO (DUF488 family)
MAIRIKRVYDAPGKNDGTRVLVDRIWPRGLSKESAAIDVWMKEVAPSTALRKWFGHDPARWDEFQSRYRKELDRRGDAVAELVRLAKQGRLTLVYAAKDEDHNNAVVLKEYVEEQSRCA